MAAALKNSLAYNPTTGSFTWKRRDRAAFACDQAWRAWNTKFAGKEAGSVNVRKDGKYRVINLSGRRHYAHHLAFKYMTGVVPTAIDHINGNGLDNRWVNLRAATVQENARNMKRNTRNKSGVTGVYWAKEKHKWAVQIGIDGSMKFLGRFSDFFEACCVRKAAELSNGFHENHGSVR